MIGLTILYVLHHTTTDQKTLGEGDHDNGAALQYITIGIFGSPESVVQNFVISPFL